MPMVPPWADDPAAADPSALLEAPPSDDKPQDGSAPPALAPAARFGTCRTALGSYATSGDRDDLRRSLGAYTRRGYGGAGNLTRRFGGAARTAGALGGILSGGAGEGRSTEFQTLRGRSAREIIDAVAHAARPIDGTQDAEVARAAIADALTALLKKFPDADLLELTEDQREFAVEQYVAFEVFRRFELDVGKAIQDKAPSATTGLSRLRQARSFVRQAVAAAFRKVRTAGQRVTRGDVARTVRQALRQVFDVFVGYSE